MSDGVSHALITAGSTLAIALLQVFREYRNRKWLKQDLEARDQAAKGRTGKVLTSIAENTEISNKAFHEANNINVKLLNIHDRVDRQEQVFRAKLAELDAMLPAVTSGQEDEG